ncbi:uncharacterized protein LOC62_07G009699 [Vanrija pseudolonga]|uniref:Uncharacterized protein n=1 Tax=Vanrija pseudolonga TaxID=143232 RepID=A0AAF1BLR0_9TREE|nr:hypothetical protein LOC62_07G009699 [Vanrija pseudolonga]
MTRHRQQLNSEWAALPLLAACVGPWLLVVAAARYFISPEHPGWVSSFSDPTSVRWIRGIWGLVFTFELLLLFHLYSDIVRTADKSTIVVYSPVDEDKRLPDHALEDDYVDMHAHEFEQFVVWSRLVSLVKWNLIMFVHHIATYPSVPVLLSSSRLAMVLFLEPLVHVYVYGGDFSRALDRMRAHAVAMDECPPNPLNTGGIFTGPLSYSVAAKRAAVLSQLPGYVLQQLWETVAAAGVQGLEARAAVQAASDALESCSNSDNIDTVALLADAVRQVEMLEAQTRADGLVCIEEKV